MASVNGNTGTHGYSQVQPNIRLTGDWDGHMPDISYPNGEYLLCVVVEGTASLFGGPYTGSLIFNPPEWMTIGAQGSCAGEIYDTFQIGTPNNSPTGDNKDGFFSVVIGAISMTNYEGFQWPAYGFGGPAFSYHIAIFRRGNMATNDHTYLVNLNEASGSGSGAGKCLNGGSNCQSFAFIYPCNDLMVTETLRWNDPPGSCTTGPDTSCYWSNIVHQRGSGGGWNQGLLSASSNNQVTLSSNMGYTEWWTDSLGIAATSTEGIGPHSDRTYSYIAPSPPGLSYEYAPASPPPARRQLLEDEIDAGVKRLHDRHNAEARSAVAWLGSIVNGSFANNPRNESYRSMILGQWHEYLSTNLQPRWAEEVQSFKEHKRRELHDVTHDHPPPLPPPPSPPVTGGDATGTPGACPVAKPAEHAICAYSASPGLSCHYDEVCCALTGNCYNTTIATCTSWNYWVVTTKSLDCAEAQSPSAPPPPPYPNVLGVNDTLWERAIAGALSGVMEGDVHVTIEEQVVAACVHTPTHADHWNVMDRVNGNSFTSQVGSETGTNVALTQAPYSLYPS